MTRRIRIIHVLYRMGTGGTELALRRLVAELDPQRFENIICTIAPLPATEDVAGARCLNLNRSGSKTGFLLPEFIRLFLRERPDVVHSRNWGAIEAAPAAWLARVPRVVHSEHGRDIHTMNGDPWRRRIFRRFCYSVADEIFAVSHELSEHYAAQLGISATRMKVIPNGVNTAKFRPDAEARTRFRERLGVASDVIVLGTLARLDPVKDHRTLLQAAAHAIHAGAPLHLAIVGDGPERERLRDLAASDAALRNRVTFVGETSQPEDCLNGFDIFALSSLSEGMSNTVLEAMATALPCVVTRVGSNPDLVEEGRTGFLVGARDAQALAQRITALAANPQLRGEMGLQGRRKVESQFSSSAMVESYSRLYTSAAQEQPVAPVVLGRV